MPSHAAHKAMAKHAAHKSAVPHQPKLATRSASHARATPRALGAVLGACLGGGGVLSACPAAVGKKVVEGGVWGQVNPGKDQGG